MFRHEELLAAVLAAGGDRTEAVVGVVHDSGGPGPDGTIWGGEILVGAAADGDAGFERAGLLFPVRMPGGEVAAEEPWRMACAWLAAATGVDSPPMPAALAELVEPERWEAVAEMARTGLVSPLTTSTGCLLAAVGCLTESGEEVTASAEVGERAYPMPLIEEGDAPLILDARATVAAALDGIASGVAPSAIRGGVLAAVAEGTASAVSHVMARSGITTVALAGDAFAEPALLDRTAALLLAEGVRVLTPQRS